MKTLVILSVAFALENVTGLELNDLMITRCGDVRSDCELYKHACDGVFESWARTNCASMCGYCTGEAICEDSVDCAHLPGSVCTDSQYMQFAQTSCSKFCGFYPLSSILG